MIFSLMQTVYQIRDGKLTGITNKDRSMGMLPRNVWRYFDGGDCGEQHKPFQPQQTANYVPPGCNSGPKPLGGHFFKL